ncbi:MAG: TonB C-terminal domain-containing protein [Deltaproteobacteria bacterium]|nr:TonB C-terminal domain-containing protein [Deltaproteobacteria bacterium]
MHAGIFIFLIASPFLPFKPYSRRNEKVTWINLPKGATGLPATSMKKSEWLPKSTIQEQKKPLLEKEEPQKKTPSMTYKTNEKPKEKGVKKLKEKTEEEKKMEEILSRAKQEVTKRKVAEPEAAQIVKGTQGGVPYGSTQGPFSSPNDLERAQYTLEVRNLIVKEWIPPLNTRSPSLGLICKVIVRINERGEVIETRWDQRSGNESFDLSALRAIMKASPLKPPPERLKMEAIHEGFIFEFHPALLNGQT